MMTTLTIVLAEITTVLLAVVIVISVKALQRRRRDQDAVNTLVISIKANQPARVEKLAGMLKDSSHLSEDDALNKANELIKKQNKFYQDAIDLYFTRNNEVLSKLDNRLEDLLDQYQGLLKVSAADNTGVDAEAMGQLSKDIAALSKEIEELRSENATLSTQLKAAEHELDQLGREYVSAFNKPKVAKAKGEKMEESQVVEDGQVEAAKDEQTGTEAVASSTAHLGNADGEGSDIAEEAEAEQAAGVEPAAEEALIFEAGEPTPNSATTDGNANAEPDSKASFMDDAGDQNLFADLGLDELIGDHPGQQAIGGKSTGKK
jgi:FtsZ-binding cell division protein ZapB